MSSMAGGQTEELADGWWTCSMVQADGEIARRASKSRRMLPARKISRGVALPTNRAATLAQICHKG